MIAMIFEYGVRPGREEEYRSESAELRARLRGRDGFHGVERFESCAEPGRFVAVGFFADERAVSAWRTDPEHRRVQALGRERLLTGYRLRMARVVRDYGSADRVQAPSDSRRVHVLPEGRRDA